MDCKQPSTYPPETTSSLFATVAATAGVRMRRAIPSKSSRLGRNTQPLPSRCIQSLTATIMSVQHPATNSTEIEAELCRMAGSPPVQNEAYEACEKRPLSRTKTQTEAEMSGQRISLARQTPT